MTQVKVDTTGLSCPMPFLKLRRALAGLEPGTLVEVKSTDPLAPGDFAELCAAQGHQIVRTENDGAVAVTLIEVQAAQSGVK
jgi:tRNA 2-thiouridine synthesizing protein A